MRAKREWRVWLLMPAVVLGSCRREAAGPGAGAPNPMDRVQPVETMEVGKRTMEETVELTGTLAANESAELRPELSGTLVEILFEEGAVVKEGDPVARMDTRELEAQLAEAQAKFELAGRNLERLRVLLESNAASQLECDQAKAEHDQIEATIRLVRTRIEKSTLRAPFAGVAGARSVSVGDYVSPQTMVTTVDDLSRLKVELEVPERYLTGVHPGTGFTVRTSAGGEAVKGAVYFVAASIDPRTRSATVKGLIENPPASLRPGMFANVALVLRVLEGVLVVPETALMNSPQGSSVVVAREKDGGWVADFVPVRGGLRVPGWVQVTPVGPPLAAGDRIVSAGVGGLILLPGMKLQPVDPVVLPGPPAATDRVLPGKEGQKR